MLVNPVQSFHPNTPPPNDAVLLTSEVRRTEDRAALQRVADAAAPVCNAAACR